MKKSTKSLSLVLMGSLTVALGGCASEPEEAFQAYNSIDQCIKEQIFSEQECRDSAVAAAQQNPLFANQAECEREFGTGNCQTSPQSNPQAGSSDEQVAGSGERGSSWMPLMAGYMMGRYLSGGSFMQGSQPLYKQNAPAGAQPGAAAGARTSGGFGNSFRTAGGASIQTDAAGKVASPPQAVRQGFAKSAKPYAGRSGIGSRGGFAGSKGFGGAAS